MKRRDFLQSMSLGVLAATAGSAIPSWVWGRDKNLPEPNFGKIPSGIGQLYFCAGVPVNVVNHEQAGGYLYEIDLAAEKTRKALLENKKTHSILRVSAEKNFFLAIDQEDTRASFVDPVDMRVLSVISIPDPLWFSGHGEYKKESGELFLPVFPKDKKTNGFVYVYERKGKAWKRTKKFPSLAPAPHSVIALKEKDYAAIGHYGGFFTPGYANERGVLSIVHLKTGKIEAVKEAKYPGTSLCHLALDKKGDVIISTRSWRPAPAPKDPKQVVNILADEHLPSPIMFGSWKDAAFTESMPPEWKERFRFNFSVCYREENDTAAVCHIAGNMVSFWKVSERKLLKVQELGGQGPLGIAVTADRKYFLVSTMNSFFWLYDANTMEKVAMYNAAKMNFFPGPHLEMV